MEFCLGCHEVIKQFSLTTWKIVSSRGGGCSRCLFLNRKEGESSHQFFHYSLLLSRGLGEEFRQCNNRKSYNPLLNSTLEERRVRFPASNRVDEYVCVYKIHTELKKTFYRSLRISFCHFTASVFFQELSRTAPTTSSASFRYSTCLFCSFSSLSCTAFLRYSAILSPRARRAVSISSLSFAGRRTCVRKEFAIHHYYTSSKLAVKTFLVPPEGIEPSSAD